MKKLIALPLTLALLVACSAEEVPTDSRTLPGYVPQAARGALAAADLESPEARFDERTRTFSSGEALTYWVADGMVVEGDMILHDDAEAFEALLDEYERSLQGEALGSQAMFADPHCVTRVITCLHYSRSGRQWTNGVVHFDVEALSDNFSAADRAVIEQAMVHIERETGSTITFNGVEEDERKDYPNRIIFKGEADAGCYSKVGMVGGRQTLMLGDDCVVLGTVVHELGHALGFLHEHQRPLRDDYIEVNRDNLTSKGRSNFKRRTGAATTQGNFDLLSIMMYPVSTTDTSFVRNTREPMFSVRSGVDLPINPETGRRLTLGEIGLLDFLSPRDVDALRSRY